MWRDAAAGMATRVILGLETSCDETAAALVTRDGDVLANVVASQAELHAPFGGVVPEVAARRHLELVSPVHREALARGGRDPRRRRARRGHARAWAGRRAARRPLGCEGARLGAVAPARRRSTTCTATSPRSSSGPTRSSRPSCACSRAAGTRWCSTCRRTPATGARHDARRRRRRGVRQGRAAARSRLPRRRRARAARARAATRRRTRSRWRASPASTSRSPGVKTALLYAVQGPGAGRARAAPRRPRRLLPAGDRRALVERARQAAEQTGAPADRRRRRRRRELGAAGGAARRRRRAARALHGQRCDDRLGRPVRWSRCSRPTTLSSMPTPPWRSLAAAALVLGAVVGGADARRSCAADEDDRAPRGRAPGAPPGEVSSATAAAGGRPRPARDRPAARAVARGAGRGRPEAGRRKRLSAAGRPRRSRPGAADRRAGGAGRRVRPEYSYTRVVNGFSAVARPARHRAARALAGRARRLSRCGPHSPRRGRRRPSVACGALPGRAAPPVRRTRGHRRAARHGVDPRRRFSRPRVLGRRRRRTADGCARRPAAPGRPARAHGTRTAGLVAGSAGPAACGIAPGATVLPIRVAGWQRDAAGTWSIYARTDQLIAGLERAVDPNGDGDTHDAARDRAGRRSSEPFVAFADSPRRRRSRARSPRHARRRARGERRARRARLRQHRRAGRRARGAHGRRGRPAAGGSRSSVSCPRRAATSAPPAARAARRRRRPVRRRDLPTSPVVATPRDLFDPDGLQPRRRPRGAARRPGAAPRRAAARAAEAGAAAVVLYGDELPAGALGSTRRRRSRAVAVPAALPRALGAAARGQRRPSLASARARTPGTARLGVAAAFSSRGLAFDGTSSPTSSRPASRSLTAGRAATRRLPRFVTASGTSAAAAVVAGAAALLVQARPALDARGLRSLLVGDGPAAPRAALTAQGAGRGRRRRRAAVRSSSPTAPPLVRPRDAATAGGQAAR